MSQTGALYKTVFPHCPLDKAEAKRNTKAGGFLRETYVVDEKASFIPPRLMSRGLL